MVYVTLLMALMTSMTLASVVNICVQEPFRQMQDFRDFRPAMDGCNTHYPMQKLTKTLPDRCLTSTKTVILGTSTIPAIKNLPCPTTIKVTELRIREVAVGDVGGRKKKRELEKKREATEDTASAVRERDDAVPPMPKSEKWESYFATLVQSGYNYIQTACSCVASPEVVLRTPTPTCTRTLTKKKIVRETQTISVEPKNC